jgi:hypothetical protein
MSAHVSVLHEALKLLDVGGSSAICAGVDRVRARILTWPLVQFTSSNDVPICPAIPRPHDTSRNAALGMLAPLPDQVIFNILERLQSKDLRK